MATIAFLLIFNIRCISVLINTYNTGSDCSLQFWLLPILSCCHINNQSNCISLSLKSLKYKKNSKLEAVAYAFNSQKKLTLTKDISIVFLSSFLLFVSLLF